MTLDDSSQKYVQWDSTTLPSDGPDRRPTAREDVPPTNPSIIVTATDDTQTQLNGINKHRGMKLDRALTGLDNDDNHSIIPKSLSPGSLSEGQTTINGHGDAAQLKRQNGKTQTEPPWHSNGALAGVGGGMTDKPPETGSGLVLSDCESEDGEDLWTSIDDRLISLPLNDGKQFLPLDELRSSISRENVQRTLKKLKGFSRAEAHAYADQVCETTKVGSTQRLTTRQRMFATLVIIEHIDALPGLISENLYDIHLPLDLRREEGGNKWHLYYKPIGSETYVRFKGTESWRNPKVKAFYEKQWLVLSPFFDMRAGKPLFYPLEDRIILPLIEGGEGQGMTLGGFSTVWRAKFHPEHHNYLQDPNPTFAVKKQDPNPSFAIKKLLSDDKAEFDREVEAMKKVNRQNHQHLTTLLATYQHHGHWYFVFPWADGNLREFWQLYDKPLPSHSLVVWLAEQCAGIASGLELIQHLPADTSLSVPNPDRRDFGRHGDLKPENVLWFRDYNQDESIPGGGMLKIADFGLTRFHHDLTKSDVNARGLGVSLTYKAPEVDLVVRVSQSYDIWTLGCMLLEFVTWYLKGWEGVDDFSANRANDDEGNDIPLDTFYNVVFRGDKKGADVKNSVRQWVQELHRHPNCSLFLHRLLTYTSHHLLRIGAKERHKCVDVVATLNRMANRCSTDIIFACHGCPKPPNKTDTIRTDNTVSDDGWNGGENRGPGSPEPSYNPSSEMCSHGTFVEEDDFRVLDEVPDNESISNLYPDHGPMTNGTTGLHVVDQPTTSSMNNAQGLVTSRVTNSMEVEDVMSSKRGRDRGVEEDSSWEAKRRKLPDDETTLYGSDESQKEHV